MFKLNKKAYEGNATTELVAKVVSLAIKSGYSGNQITKEKLDEAAMLIIGKPLRISEEEIQTTLDPTESVRTRAVRGGPSPTEVS